MSGGETDLATILAGLVVARRPEPVTVVSIDGPAPLGDGIEALISEREGTTVVATVDEARRRGWSVDFEAAWLTIGVHSSLEAVGLTAVLATTLADHGIPANVVAGYYHDHLLVPLHRADDAIAALEALSEGGGRSPDPQ